MPHDGTDASCPVVVIIRKGRRDVTSLDQLRQRGRRRAAGPVLVRNGVDFATHAGGAAILIRIHPSFACVATKSGAWNNLRT